MKKVLLVDDEPSMRELLCLMLRKDGYEVQPAEGFESARRALAKGPPDALVTDLKLPDGDGMEILRQVKSTAPETVVVVITAFGSTQTAIEALKLGAHDYLVKPFDVEELKIVLRNALERQELKEENLLLKAEFRSRHTLDRIIGVAPVMTKMITALRAVAPNNSTVLISGESGVGKELVAKALHAISPRRDAAFVSVNCGALPDTLLESELFGHVRGAFTDAHQSKRGLFEAAHHGSIFLDEVGETSPAMQVKLLRAVQERRVRRVGGTEEIEIDVRIIAATNRSLEELVRERRFREDLYYRLNVIPLRVPPLRERREDIPLLADHFLRRFVKEMGKNLAAISENAMRLLLDYDWPGNVRELENVVERAVVLETTSQIQPERLILGLAAIPGGSQNDDLGKEFSLDAYLDDIELKLLRKALGQSGGDRSHAARLLGITLRSFRYRTKKHHLGLDSK
ncbi:MAG: sigma-54-dependent Fis family transcriptional regulator [Vicinamibacteria bacterium]|nr:sigma-54-dependent Fis family transcriptional regulator [Vicinamibacteria bacterium]